MLYMPQSLKQCSKCGEWKLANATQFTKDRLRLGARCRACECTLRRTRHQENKHEINDAKRRRYASNKEHYTACRQQYREINKERLSARDRQYREANKERIAQKDRRYRETQRERIGTYQQGYRRTHAEYIRQREQRYYAAHRESVAEGKRRYYQINKRAILQRTREHYQARKDYVARYNQQWRQTESGKRSQRACFARRKARKLAVGGNHTAADIRRQYDAQQGRCHYCQTEVGNTYHVDHFVPLAKGGSNGPENIVIACPTCNMRKRDKMPEVFLAELKRSDHD